MFLELCVIYPNGSDSSYLFWKMIYHKLYPNLFIYACIANKSNSIHYDWNIS